MREDIDVHQTKHRYEVAIKNLKAGKAISHHNRRIILRFLWDFQAQGIGLPRLLKYLNLLFVVARDSKKVSGPKRPANRGCPGVSTVA